MEIDPTSNQPIKIVTVGDHLVGKSCAITTFVTSHSPVERQSTVFDSSHCEIKVDGCVYNLSIWDTTGNAAYKDLIKSCYKDAQVFLIFFSVIDPDTFKNATEKWYKQVKEANSKALVFFVGNKIDQRNMASTGRVVTTKEAQDKIQQQMKCKYLECSAISRQGLINVFEYSVRQDRVSKTQNSKVRTKQKNQPDACCLLM